MEIRGPLPVSGRRVHDRVRHVFGRTSISTPTTVGHSGASVDPQIRPVAINLEPDEHHEAVRENSSSPESGFRPSCLGFAEGYAQRLPLGSPVTLTDRTRTCVRPSV